MTAPTPQTVGSVNWISFAAQVIAIVDRDSGDVGIGQLTSLRYNARNGQYLVGLGVQVLTLNVNDQVTVAKVVAGATAASLGLP